MRKPKKINDSSKETKVNFWFLGEIYTAVATVWAVQGTSNTLWCLEAVLDKKEREIVLGCSCAITDAAHKAVSQELNSHED